MGVAGIHGYIQQTSSVDIGQSLTIPNIWTGLLKLANNYGDTCGIYVIEGSGATLIGGNPRTGITVSHEGSTLTITNNTTSTDTFYVKLWK